MKFTINEKMDNLQKGNINYLEVVTFVIFTVSQGFGGHLIGCTNRQGWEGGGEGSLWAILETSQHHLECEDNCHTCCQINFFPESVSNACR